MKKRNFDCHGSRLLECHASSVEMFVGGVLGVFMMFSLASLCQAQDQLSEPLEPPANPNSEPIPTNTLPTEPAANGELPVPVEVAPSSDPRDQIYLGLEAEESSGKDKGVRVTRVTEGSPAWKAGFQENDRIIGINRMDIAKLNDMVEQLAKARPGQSVTFLIQRADRMWELTAVLTNAAMAEQLQKQRDNAQDTAAWVGLSVHDLSQAFRDQFGITAFQGAAVSQVVPGSPAHRAGIRAGDAITEVQSRPIDSASQFVNWLESTRPGDQVTMLVYRGITRLPLTLVIGSEPQPKPSSPTLRANPNSPSPRSVPRANPKTRALRPSSSLPSPGPATAPEGDPAVTPELLSVVPPGQSGPKESVNPTRRERELEAEVTRLRDELADAKAKLAEATEQLNNVLKALRN